MKLKSLVLAAAAMVFAAGLLSAHAETYPSKPITMIVPFAAGGPTDTVARTVAGVMSKSLGQQVIIENGGAAGGNIGLAHTVAPPPEGYTTLLRSIGFSTV